MIFLEGKNCNLKVFFFLDRVSFLVLGLKYLNFGLKKFGFLLWKFLELGRGM